MSKTVRVRVTAEDSPGSLLNLRGLFFLMLTIGTTSCAQADPTEVVGLLERCWEVNKVEGPAPAYSIKTDAMLSRDMHGGLLLISRACPGTGLSLNELGPQAEKWLISVLSEPMRSDPIGLHLSAVVQPAGKDQWGVPEVNVVEVTSAHILPPIETAAILKRLREVRPLE